jgi:hypothetical protein
MTLPTTSNGSDKPVRALKHFAAVMVLGFPVLIMIFFWLRNPDPVIRMWIPNPDQYYLGTVMSIIMLMALGLCYVSVILTANTIVALYREGLNGIQRAVGWIKILFLWMGGYFLLSIGILIGLLGPMMLRLNQSPVGNMFFGG